MWKILLIRPEYVWLLYIGLLGITWNFLKVLSWAWKNRFSFKTLMWGLSLCLELREPKLGCLLPLCKWVASSSLAFAIPLCTWPVIAVLQHLFFPPFSFFGHSFTSETHVTAVSPGTAARRVCLDVVLEAVQLFIGLEAGQSLCCCWREWAVLASAIARHSPFSGCLGSCPLMVDQVCLSDQICHGKIKLPLSPSERPGRPKCPGGALQLPPSQKWRNLWPFFMVVV